MIHSIPRRGGCAECAATQVKVRADDGRLLAVKIRHEQACPALAQRRLRPSNPVQTPKPHPTEEKPANGHKAPKE